MAIDAAFGDEAFCYLTTTGRTSGKPREIEIWFALHGATLYMLSGGGDRSDWVRNLAADPRVAVRVGGVTFQGTARIVGEPEEDALARRLVHGKYASGPDDMTRWRYHGLPVAIDLEA